MNDFDTFWHEAKAALRVALQWFFLAVPMGLLCGFLGTLFHLAVEHATELRAAQPWLLFLLPVAGLLITALYKVTKCEGVGTNNVLRAVQSGEPVSILLVPAIFLGTVLTHLCGGSAGREGAALQMGGSIGWNLGTLLRLKDHDRRTATISGMAAFFSALFGTPLAAACFAMMVEDVGLTFTAAFVPAFTSAQAAAQGTCMVLRLWNQGGRDKENEEVMRIIEKYVPKPWKERPDGFRLCDHLYLEFDRKFEWPNFENDIKKGDDNKNKDENRNKEEISKGKDKDEISEGKDKNEGNGENREVFCKALLKQIGVLADGSLVPCCLDHNGDVILGNLLHQSLEEILSSPRAQAMIEGFKHHTATEALCQNCESALVRNSFRGKARN